VVALAEFKKQPLDVNLAKEALRDVLAVRARQINIENIKRVVAEYYRISVRDLTGKKRSRIYARPRQMAMALARELTSKSYPDIGQEFDGRDHTTVIHACRQIDGLKESEPSLAEDYNNLLRSLQA
jgi:chromosomal replication initiator protein